MRRLTFSSSIPLASIPVIALLLGFSAPPAAASIAAELREAVRLFESGETAAPKFHKKRVVTANGVIHVRGKKERRQLRHAHWTALLDGDRRAIRDREGHPTNRHFELSMGDRTEHWTYPDKGITYVFRGNTLLRTELY